MPLETPVLNYRSPETGPLAGRPRRLLSHCRTAAFLCLVTIAFDLKIVALRGEVRQIPALEWALPVYGALAALLSIVIGRLLPSDKVWLGCCTVVYLLTLAWAMLPRLNY